MARPQEALNKKEFEKRKLAKRKEKEARKKERKANAKPGPSFEDMIAYIDENGNITSTPPDPSKKKVVNESDIVIGANNKGSADQTDAIRQGKVTFFNGSKGYGFIKDSDTGESIFVHSNGLQTPIAENDKVTFEVERGPKGLNAVRVSVVRK